MAILRRCTTCRATLRPKDVRDGCRRCHSCRKATPRVRGSAMSTTPCVTCVQLLTLNELRIGLKRCGRCRFNNNGAAPKPTAKADVGWGPSWWMLCPTGAELNAEATRRHPNASEPVRNSIALGPDGGRNV